MGKGVLGPQGSGHRLDERAVERGIHGNGVDETVPFDPWSRQPVDSSRSAASCPGRNLASTVASAVEGTTFVAYPAASIVGFAVFRSDAPTILAKPPSCARQAPGSPPPSRFR